MARDLSPSDERISAPLHGGTAWLSVATVLISALVAGCVPSATTPNPALDVPSTYRFAGPKAGLVDHATDWWRTFHDPELTRFMEQTEVENLDIAAAIGQVEQADALARQTGANLLPSITANDTATRALSSSNIFSGVSTGTTTSSSAATSGTLITGSTSNTPRTDLVAAFGASYQLDFWGRNRALYKGAQENATASRWNRQTVQLTSLASTATTYFTILAARERIAFAQQNVRDSSGILKLIKDRQAAGTATDLDVAQQAALVANLRASIPALQVIVEQDIATLAILLGVPPERVRIAGKGVLAKPVPTIAPGIPSEVLTLRPDIEFAEANLASAHANLVAARAAFFPTLTLTAQGGFESLALKTPLLSGLDLLHGGTRSRPADLRRRSASGRVRPGQGPAGPAPGRIPKSRHHLVLRCRQSPGRPETLCPAGRADAPIPYGIAPGLRFVAAEADVGGSRRRNFAANRADIVHDPGHARSGAAVADDGSGRPIPGPRRRLRRTAERRDVSGATNCKDRGRVAHREEVKRA